MNAQGTVHTAGQAGCIPDAGEGGLPELAQGESAFDWSTTPLAPAALWSQALHVAVQNELQAQPNGPGDLDGPFAAEWRRMTDTELLGANFSSFSGRISYANAAFLRMSGYTAQDAANGSLSWEVLMETSSLPGTFKALQQLRHGAQRP